MAIASKLVVITQNNSVSSCIERYFKAGNAIWLVEITDIEDLCGTLKQFLHIKNLNELSEVVLILQ